MRNNLIHTIKVGLDKNPDFYKPLAQRLDELIKQRKDERITQIELLKMFADIQDEIISEQKEGEDKGFKTAYEKAVYSSMKILFGGDAEDATKTIFELIKGELNIVGWEGKGQVQKDMENKIMRYLKTAKIERSDAKVKSKELVDIIKKNRDA